MRWFNLKCKRTWNIPVCYWKTLARFKISLNVPEGWSCLYVREHTVVHLHFRLSFPPATYTLRKKVLNAFPLKNIFLASPHWKLFVPLPFKMKRGKKSNIYFDLCEYSLKVSASEASYLYMHLRFFPCHGTKGLYSIYELNEKYLQCTFVLNHIHFTTSEWDFTVQP